LLLVGNDAPVWLYELYLIASIFAALIAAGALIALYYQTKAANRTAKYVMNADRAWLMVDVDSVPGMGAAYGSEMVNGVHVANTSVRIRIQCRNDGKTPAWITEIRARLNVISGYVKSPDLESTEVLEPNPEPVAPQARSAVHDHTLTCTKIAEPGQILVLYGVVFYRDMFEAERYTTFGYTVSMVDGKLRRLPYPEFNENS